MLSKKSKPLSPEQMSRHMRRALERREKKLGHPLSKDEVYATKVSVVPLWKRLLFITSGVGLLLIALYLALDESSLWAVGFFTLLGTVVILIGVWGGRKTIKNIEEATGIALDQIIIGLY